MRIRKKTFLISENNEKHNIPIIVTYSIDFTSHIKFYYIFIEYEDYIDI